MNAVVRTTEWLSGDALLAPCLYLRPISLFDGKTFAGWQGDTVQTWRIENGALVDGSMVRMMPHNEFLTTTKAYANFDLTLQFKLIGIELIKLP